MPTFQFEARDTMGNPIEDVIEAQTEDEALATIRQMGYFVTRISVKKGRGAQDKKGAGKKKRGFSLGGANSKQMTTFTRQLAILQDAGLPILRSLRILEMQNKPGALKNALTDVCEEIESGATLSEAMAKSPKVFSRLYINMIRAGEAGGALELILQRLAEFMERAQEIKRKVKGALIYPVVVVLVAVGILTFIMLKIVPAFAEMFAEFDFELPKMTIMLINISNKTVMYWYLIPAVPFTMWLSVKLLRKFKAGRMGWDLFIMRLPIFGGLVEKNIMARTTRTLGTLVASGVPILEALSITKETSNNGMFERMYGKITEAIREGETIAKPMRDHSKPPFHLLALLIWVTVGCAPILFALAVAELLNFRTAPIAAAGAAVAAGWYLLTMRKPIAEEMVVNMVDVGEETGELDTMLYKVADYFDDEVRTMTDGLMKLMEPLMIVFLGGAVGFIVIALFLPLVALIQNLS
jgi:type IV pilus assembly protein PilC